jgi:hypothetical protein
MPSTRYASTSLHDGLFDDSFSSQNKQTALSLAIETLDVRTVNTLLGHGVSVQVSVNDWYASDDKHCSEL